MSIMSNTMKKIVTVLLMVVFTVLAAGCENQDEKFKRLESELYDVGKKWDVSYDKAIETLDEKLLKEAAKECHEKSTKLTDELVKTAKGNAAYQQKADQLKQAYKTHSEKILKLTYEDIQKIKFEKLKKKMNKLMANFNERENECRSSDDQDSFEKLVQEFAANGKPLIEDMFKTAGNNKSLLNDAKSYESDYNIKKDLKWENVRINRKGTPHKVMFEDRYPGWFK